ncbi:potassium/sodium hyperpolarization-activated cyclic nucleotide-gated channel 1-like [Halictus rubicundus]|uniref:potassium/sodium hyperpolarization-activated cyclic nucleotide-gated channel 1-like n=1 Tax=Halictus rubicundus TaxID=77578 RepID=UPI0040361DD0
MHVDKLLKKGVDVHVCELPKTSRSNLPKLPPNAKFYTRWKRKFQKLILVSENHPLTHNTLRSYAAIAFEKRRHGRSSYWWIIHPCSEFRHYARSFFFFDLVSSIPLIWFYKYRIDPPGPNARSLFLIPELLPMLKLGRIWTLRVYIRQITASFTISHATDKALWLVVFMMLLFHWCCCVTHSAPIVFSHMDRSTMEESELYLVTSGVYKKSMPEIYLQYIHMGVSNFFGSSFTELYSLETKDTAIRCMLLILGKGCLIYIIVMILQLAKSAAEPELKYQRIMYKVNEYIHEKKLPERLKSKLLVYYEYRFQGSFFKEKAISNTLSNHLYQEIMIHSSRGLLHTATLLHYLPRTTIGNLMGILRPVIYLKEDIIYESESEGEDMFFIVSGTVALITFDGKEICHEIDGGYFGESALIYPDRRRLESAMALEVCELLRLNRRDFKRMFPPSSKFYKRLEKSARERHERMLITSSHTIFFEDTNSQYEGI